MVYDSVDNSFVTAYIRIKNVSSENIRIRVEVRDYGTSEPTKIRLGVLISFSNTPAMQWIENDATNAQYSVNACLAPAV